MANFKFNVCTIFERPDNMFSAFGEHLPCTQLDELTKNEPFVSALFEGQDDEIISAQNETEEGKNITILALRDMLF